MKPLQQNLLLSPQNKPVQQTIFNECIDSSTPQIYTKKIWRMYVDGASRGNPGNAGAGIFVISEDRIILQEGYSLGIKTNNEAEYLALVIGLFLVKPYVHSDHHLDIISDSELLINQMIGSYKVKKPSLKQLHTFARALLHNINTSFCHVLRDRNKAADALANEGIDLGNPVPEPFIQLLRQHEIPF